MFVVLIYYNNKFEKKIIIIYKGLLSFCSCYVSLLLYIREISFFLLIIFCHYSNALNLKFFLCLYLFVLFCTTLCCLRLDYCLRLVSEKLK